MVPNQAQIINPISLTLDIMFVEEDRVVQVLHILDVNRTRESPSCGQLRKKEDARQADFHPEDGSLNSRSNGSFRSETYSRNLENQRVVPQKS